MSFVLYDGRNNGMCALDGLFNNGCFCSDEGVHATRSLADLPGEISKNQNGEKYESKNERKYPTKPRMSSKATRLFFLYWECFEFLGFVKTFQRRRWRWKGSWWWRDPWNGSSSEAIHVGYKRFFEFLSTDFLRDILVKCASFWRMRSFLCFRFVMRFV